ncbi:hypothetical protein PR202_gb06459 [Eleusine coracana subsp. coracana]|uniref:Uncharacterized protein n=1 Tax=Eleusine coracana subsp. coracana TaxID=191504 RepID=A0AAV5E9J2_ELECO|nr:hypothetical protein PR202_gb06459 [Eleusine coracana subsp. coracana]
MFFLKEELHPAVPADATGHISWCPGGKPTLYQNVATSLTFDNRSNHRQHLMVEWTNEIAWSLSRSCRDQGGDDDSGVSRWINPAE